MKKNTVVAAFAIFLALFLGACGDETNKELNTSTQNNQASNSKNASVNYQQVELIDAGDSFTVKHSLGENKVVKNPSKVVILDFGSLDSFEALALDDKVVGVPSKNLPQYLQKFKDKKSTGGVQQLDFEAINELKPDLIIISGRQAKHYEKLNQIAPTIYLGLDNADILNSFQNNVLSIAKLYNKENEAQEKINALKEKINQAKQSIDPNKTGLILLTNANRISTFGPASRFGLIHDVLGIKAVDENIKVGTHGKSISPEYILEANPDYIFVIDRNIIVGSQERAKNTLDNALIAKTKAAQNNKIIYLNPEFWYLSGGGLISLENMIDEIINSIK